MQFVPEEGVYAYFRYDEKQTVMVIMNQNDKEMPIDMNRFAERTRGFSQAKDIAEGKSPSARRAEKKYPPKPPWYWSCFRSCGFGVWSLEFGVWGLGFGVWGLGFGVWSFGSLELEFGVSGFGGGLGFGVWSQNLNEGDKNQ
jgi:hypothetical protein